MYISPRLPDWLMVKQVHRGTLLQTILNSKMYNLHAVSLCIADICMNVMQCGSYSKRCSFINICYIYINKYIHIQNTSIYYTIYLHI